MGAACVPLAAQAQLYIYSFGDLVANTSTTSAGTTTTSAIFSSFSATGLSPGTVNATNRFSMTGWDIGATTGSDTFTGAINLGKYFEFTITPQAGYSLDLNQITLGFQRSSTGVRQFAVRSSIDAFGSNLAASISPANANGSVVPTNVFQTTDATNVLIPGNTITLDSAYDAITTPITFRFYGFNAEATTGTFSVDDVATFGIANFLAARNLTWNPSVGLTSWNTSDTNWLLNGATPVAFQALDNVNFTQAGLANGSTVTIDAAGVSASQVNVSNATGNYTLQMGTVTASVLTKTGAGTLTLSSVVTADTYQINHGTVTITSSDRLSDSGTLNIGDGATFDLAGNDETIGSISLTGGTIASGAGFLIMAGNITTSASALSSTISGNLNTGAAVRSLTVADGTAAVDLKIDADITGGTRLTLNGPGVIALNGTNAGHTGGFTIPASGNIAISTPSALGGGTLFFNAGTVNATAPLTGANAITTPVSLGGNIALGGSDMEWAGGWTLAFAGAQNRTITVNNSFTFQGDLTSFDAVLDTINLLGTGDVTFAGLGSALALLNTDGPDVSVTGLLTSAVTVVAGTLDGTGTVSGLATIGNSTGSADSILAPGVGDLGTFTVGGLSLNSDAAFSFELNSDLVVPGSDLLVSTGAVSLGAGVAALNLTDLGSTTLAIGTQFTLIDNQSVLPTTGFFIGLAEGAIVTAGTNQFEIRYAAGIDANDVVLIAAIPEPATLSTLLLGAGGLLGFRRLRRRAAAQSRF